LPFEANGVLLAVAASAFFGCGIVSARRVLVAGNPNVGAMVSILAGVPLLLILAFFNGEFSTLGELTVVSFIVLAIAGFVHFFAGRTVQFQAMKDIGANRAHSISNTFPIYSSLLAVAFLGEDFTLNKILAIGTIVVGAALLSSSESESGPSTRHSGLRRGVGLALLSGLLFGFSQFLTRVGVEQTTIPITGVLISYSFAIIGFLSYFGVQGSKGELSISAVRKGLGGFALSGLFIALAQVCSYTALTYTQVTVVSPVLGSQGLFTILFSYFIIKRLEVFTSRVLSGALLVVAGIVLLYLPSLAV